MFFEASSSIYHSPITIGSLTYRSPAPTNTDAGLLDAAERSAE